MSTKKTNYPGGCSEKSTITTVAMSATDMLSSKAGGVDSSAKNAADNHKEKARESRSAGCGACCVIGAPGLLPAAVIWRLSDAG
jgi:hypothetical protein